ncbi:endonuclease/exonuclease/phosphatase family protein [Nocardioides caldifontis]|uniref:endonuclease/exonuclease/phosphatase family protein n=1 Tax=Nocardioides caldifontis TaxID=2588938 RepID=UPI0011DF943D|nr:endonuclease/exonuclease/phosphatase family protein [Nocardioides caldifontis]
MRIPKAFRSLALTFVATTALSTGLTTVATQLPANAAGSPSDLVTAVQAKKPKKKRTTVVKDLSFNVASFNILGSNHTDGKKKKRSRYASGVTRARWAVDLLKTHKTSVVGFSEIQPDQLRTVLAYGGGKYTSYPSPDAPKKAVPTAIVWKKRWWTLVSTHELVVPFLGQKRPQAAIVLQHKTTGQKVGFVNVHLTPVRKRDKSFGEKERNIGTNRMIKQAQAFASTGIPVFLTGDMNEREEVFCDVTTRTDMVAAAGGTNDGNSCQPPKNIGLDWIFTTPQVLLSQFRFQADPLVKKITDHRVPMVRATIPAAGS